MSHLEDMLLLHIRAAKLAEPVREYRFAAGRRWRFDFAWPHQLLAVECEGGVWSGGRHTRGAGFIADTEKYNAATLLGWRVLRFTCEAIRRGEAVNLIEAALRQARAA